MSTIKFTWSEPLEEMIIFCIIQIIIIFYFAMCKIQCFIINLSSQIIVKCAYFLNCYVLIPFWDHCSSHNAWVHQLDVRKLKGKWSKIQNKIKKGGKKRYFWALIIIKCGNSWKPFPLFIGSIQVQAQILEHNRRSEAQRYYISYSIY